MGGRCSDVLKARTHKDFLIAVKALSTDEDFTVPEKGWPWPWNDSRTTDYSYAWDEDKCWVSCFGWGWCEASRLLPGGDVYEDQQRARREWETWNREGEEPREALDPWKGENAAKTVFPDMKDRKAVAGGERSGIMVFRSR